MHHDTIGIMRRTVIALGGLAIAACGNSSTSSTGAPDNGTDGATGENDAPFADSALVSGDASSSSPVDAGTTPAQHDAGDAGSVSTPDTGTTVTPDGAPVACDDSNAATVCPNQACVNGACVGVCSPGTERCDGTDIETCNTSGEWGKATACKINNICVKDGKYGSCQPGCTSGNILCCPSGVTCYCQSEATVCPS